MKLRKLLEKDVNSYAPVLQALNNSNLEVVYFDNDEAVVKDISKLGRSYYIIGKSEKLLSYVEKGWDVCLFDDELALVCKYKNHFEGYTYYRESREKFDLSDYPYNSRLLTCDDLEFVEKYYGYPGIDPKYIKSRIKEKAIIGAFDENNNCLGFIGYHIENSIGMLYVLEEHRNKGVALFLEKTIINYFIDKNYILFNQVHPNNVKSQRLQEKLGFTKALKNCHWFW